MSSKITIRSRFSFINRIAAHFLIATFLSPLFLVGSVIKIEARTNTRSKISIPISAPLEPYLIRDAQSIPIQSRIASGIASFIPSVFGSIVSGTGTTADEKKLEEATKPVIGNREDEKNTGPEITDEQAETKTESEEEVSEPVEPPMPTGVTDFDFDGDGKADVGRWHGSNTEFKVRKSSDGNYITETIGSTGAVPAPGDFDGDGKFDVVVFNAGTWTGKKSSDGSSISISMSYQSGDMPLTGNFDQDSKSDTVLFRPSNGTWYIKYSGNGTTGSYAWGLTGDIPAPADFDGDGKSDLSVFRPSDGKWYIIRSNGGAWVIREWGLDGDVPVPADYTGDGAVDMAVYRPSNGTWYVARNDSSHVFASTYSQTWGNYGDQPVPANYDGGISTTDVATDFAIWRPSTGTYHIAKSSDSGALERHVLGVSGDIAIPSAYLKQSAFNVPADELGASRLSPRNATGSTDLYSQNFSWGRSLVSLPGRAGLDLNLGIGYNSLVWTKVGTTMVFDADAGSPTPGFRLGFPVIEPVFQNRLKAPPTEVKKFTYLMITPSGQRVEFRETNVQGIYETADGSYAQLQTTSPSNPNELVENLSITVTTTDGTKMSYAWKTGAFRCTRVQDRNGNYLDAAYDTYGNLTTVTDTLGRIITVNYTWYGAPSSITQTWKDTNGSGDYSTHTWATFTYGTKEINTAFATGITVAGPANESDLGVLEKVTYPDGSSTKFTYNDYGQIQKFENIAADSATHVLNSIETDLDTPGTNLSDCPRFTETRMRAENFNSGNAVVVNNTFTTSQSATIGGQSVSGTKVQTWVTNHPDHLLTNTYYGGSGWNEGLPLATEDCLTTDPNSCTSQKRWTWTNWTHDFPSETDYETNPRVTETRVGDGTNTKKTTIDYYQPTTGVFPYSLPETISVGDLSTVLKTQKITYNLDSAYTSKRIIGLPAQVELFEGSTSGTLMSKVSYGYDGENFAQETNQNITNVIKHDSAYGSSFVAGRGNLTTVTRHDVINASTIVTAKIRYDIAGSVVAKFDALDRRVGIEYTDAFNDTTTTRHTYAYPTKIVDPAENYSQVKYRFDMGANVWAKSPAPAGNTTGKETTREFDSIGRILKEKVINTGAYKRYQYFTNGAQLKTFATLVDADSSNTVTSADELESEALLDGAGHVRAARTKHPGSTGGWSATLTEFDLLGRVWRKSVPTEVGSTWSPTGDDSTWLWNSQEFDWKGRTTRTIPTDSTGSDGKDTLISYEGCGCAGGLVTTVQGPVTTAVDAAGNTQTTKRRTQKIYEDILGRDYKVENWDLDGGGSAPYSTVKTTFNGRDQATLVRQYSGGDTSSTYQDTTATFDGHGRLASSHKPEQFVGTTPKYTTYSYNADDSISTVTDGRGAVTNYSYNSRGLMSGITWTVPGESGIVDPHDVGFSYDDGGNRTQMTDGLGTVNYTYNSLSQLTNETRIFSDTLADKPSGDYDLNYTYHLGGQLKSLTDPWEKQINYDYDIAGRLKEVEGSASYGGITTYANNPTYRAWGGLKHLEYGNAIKADLTYDAALRPDTYNLQKTGDSAIMQKSYQYNADGNLKFVDDALNGIFDRSQTYDHQGRVVTGKSSTEASGTTVTTSQDTNLPYRQTYAYDAFDHMTSRTNRHWGVETWHDVSNNLTYTYANNRITNYGWEYDADGRATIAAENSGTSAQFYDGSGMLVSVTNIDLNNGDTAINRTYTGEGREGKRIRSFYNPNTVQWEVRDTTYYIRSSVLGGQVISEVGSTGKKTKTFVYAAGTKLAVQSEYTYNSTTTESVEFEHFDASGMSYRRSISSGAGIVGAGNYEGAPGEFDPLGGNAGIETPYVEEPEPLPDPGPLNPNYPIFDDAPMIVNGQRVTCVVDGMQVDNGCGGYLSQLGNAYDIDFQNSDPFTLNSIGIYWRVVPGSNSAPGPDPNVAYGTRDQYQYFFNYSWAAPRQPQTQPPHTPPERIDNGTLDVLKGYLNKLLADEKCGNFLRSVLANLPNELSAAGTLFFDKFSGSLSEKFDAVRNNRGFWVKDGPPRGLNNGDLISFEREFFSTSLTSTVLHSFPRYMNQSAGSYRISSGLDTALTLAHELVHGYYSRSSRSSASHSGYLTVDHNQMATAARKALVQSGLTANDIPIPGSESSSNYFGQALQLACKDVKL